MHENAENGLWHICARDPSQQLVSRQSRVLLTCLNTPDDIQTGWYADVSTSVKGLFFDISGLDVPCFRACRHSLLLSFLSIDPVTHVYVVCEVAFLPADPYSSLHDMSKVFVRVPTWCTAVLEMRPSVARTHSTDTIGTILWKQNPVLQRPFRSVVSTDEVVDAFLL
jgi:hypothetical protein